MVYQDLIDWINDGVDSGKFHNASECEQYIRNHQDFILYPSQQEAIVYVFGEYVEQEPMTERIEEAPNPLEALQRAEVNLEQENIQQEQAPPTAIKQGNLANRIFNRIKGLFRGNE